MRTVLDTNVLLSGLLWEGTPKKCLDAYRLQKRYDPILSPEMIHEFRTKLTKKFKVPLSLVRYWEEEIIQYAYLVIPQYETTVCRDEKDNIILDTAVAGKADYIITGDKDLLALGEFQNIAILSPKSFLKLLSGKA